MAQGRGTTVLAALIMFGALECCLCMEHSIGAWNITAGANNAFQKWSDDQTFYAGDTLNFQYSNASHNVVGLKTLDAFTNCVKTDATRKFTESNAVVPLATPGTKYYICGVGDHCIKGMKVSIKVNALGPAMPPMTDGASAKYLSILVIAAIFVLYF